VLKKLVEKSQKGDELGQHRSDSEKKIDLLKFMARTRQRIPLFRSNYYHILVRNLRNSLKICAIILFICTL
jgi:hypothetical protein